MRAGCVEQDVGAGDVAGRPGLRTAGPLRLGVPETFDLVEHLERNRTPFMAYAFPASLVATSGCGSTSASTVCEDWDFALRAALRRRRALGAGGDGGLPALGAVARRRRPLHAEEEWRRTEREVMARLKIDARPHVVPARDASRRSARRSRESVLERDLRALHATATPSSRSTRCGWSGRRAGGYRAAAGASGTGDALHGRRPGQPVVRRSASSRGQPAQVRRAQRRPLPRGRARDRPGPARAGTSRSAVSGSAAVGGPRGRSASQLAAATRCGSARPAGCGGCGRGTGPSRPDWWLRAGAGPGGRHVADAQPARRSRQLRSRSS